MPRLLLIEDDRAIAEPLCAALERGGHLVRWERYGGSAAAALVAQRSDLLILDLGLPDMDGIEVCTLLRAAHVELPIIVLTARQDEFDAIEGLEAGADDYVTKPFRLGELMARIRGLLRASVPGVAVAGDLRIEHHSGGASIRDRPMQLAAKEHELLWQLAVRAGDVVSRERLMDEVWGSDRVGSTKTLDVHVGWIRRKLLDAGAEHISIWTVRGIGYRLDVRDDRPEPPS